MVHGGLLKAEEAQREYPPIWRYREAKDTLQVVLDRLNAIITCPITGNENPVGGGEGCGSGESCELSRVALTRLHADPLIGFSEGFSAVRASNETERDGPG